MPAAWKFLVLEMFRDRLSGFPLPLLDSKIAGLNRHYLLDNYIIILYTRRAPTSIWTSAAGGLLLREDSYALRTAGQNRFPCVFPVLLRYLEAFSPRLGRRTADALGPNMLEKMAIGGGKHGKRENL